MKGVQRKQKTKIIAIKNHKPPGLTMGGRCDNCIFRRLQYITAPSVIPGKGGILWMILSV